MIIDGTVAVIVEFVTNLDGARVYLGVGVVTIASAHTLTSDAVSIVVLVYTGRSWGLSRRRAGRWSGPSLGLGLILTTED